MKNYTLLLLLLFLNCKEKTSFADKIQLDYPKDEKLTFQEFNEGVGETETSILYIGDEKEVVPVKYYKDLLPPIPPPPNYPFTKEELKLIPIRNKIFKKYFHENIFPSIRINEAASFDSLSSNNIQIIIKQNDTIPKYAYNYEREELKRYKAFPIFIKNISDKTLKLPINKSLGLLVNNNENKWQLIWNDDAFVCGNPYWDRWYFELKPNQILIYSMNYMEGKSKGNFRIYLPFGLKSQVFEMKYDPEIIKKQKRIYEISE